MKRLVVIVVISLGGCTAYPYVSYYELDAAIAAAETEEERQYYLEHQRTVEDNALAADRFIELMPVCTNDPKCRVHCDWYGPHAEMDIRKLQRQGVLSDVERLSRWWTIVRPPTCGFVEVW